MGHSVGHARLGDGRVPFVAWVRAPIMDAPWVRAGVRTEIGGRGQHSQYTYLRCMDAMRSNDPCRISAGSAASGDGAALSLLAGRPILGEAEADESGPEPGPELHARYWGRAVGVAGVRPAAHQAQIAAWCVG